MILYKDIPGYEDHYRASSKGEIISVARISPQNHFLPKRKLIARPTNRGYKVVALCKKGIVHWYSVHRLVILAFKGKSSKEVNHIDGDKLNNKINNLEYVSRKENHLHAKRLGLTKSWVGEYNPKAKLDSIKVSEIRRLYKSSELSQKQIAKIFGIDQTSVSDIVLEKSWR